MGLLDHSTSASEDLALDRRLQKALGAPRTTLAQVAKKSFLVIQERKSFLMSYGMNRIPRKLFLLKVEVAINSSWFTMALSFC